MKNRLIKNNEINEEEYIRFFKFINIFIYITFFYYFQRLNLPLSSYLIHIILTYCVKYFIINLWSAFIFM